MLNLFIIIFTILLLIYLFIIFKGPSVWDRLLGFNLFSINMIILIILYALIKDIDYLLDLAIIYSLLGFIGIIFISRFIERKGNV